MGVQRTRDGRELEHARAVIATCARAAGLVALDTPWADIEDIDGLVADAERAKGRRLRRQVRHPSDAHRAGARVFSPSEADIAQARSVLEAWDGAEARATARCSSTAAWSTARSSNAPAAVLEQAEAIAKATGATT